MSDPTPATASAAQEASALSTLSHPVSVAFSGIFRRLSSEPTSRSRSSSRQDKGRQQQGWASADMNGALYSPPNRTESPFQPPPLTPLSLHGWRRSTSEAARLLSKSLAEEIRLLVPARNQLVDKWQLVYSLDQDGSSLSTLYARSDAYRGKRGGFVLAVRDGSRGVFGSYLSDPPRPAPHFYGNGECFLWRATVLPTMPTLASLPPPPSEDTTHAQRMTTIGQTRPTQSSKSGHASKDGTATPERIRFKAFPYSGENDYMIFCEASYLSIGGGDGHYGLWLDDNLDKGISSSCPTFGNEPLSDDGTKFDVIGVELWFIGS